MDEEDALRVQIAELQSQNEELRRDLTKMRMVYAELRVSLDEMVSDMSLMEDRIRELSGGS
jgi:hypothetical protein